MRGQGCQTSGSRSPKPRLPEGCWSAGLDKPAFQSLSRRSGGGRGPGEPFAEQIAEGTGSGLAGGYDLRVVERGG